MPYQDQFSGYSNMKGITVDLPFVKFKYVKVDRVENEKPKTARTIDLAVPGEVKPSITPSRLIVTREAEITTLGLDPMISNASVIHELAYGRIDSQQVYQQQASSYPAAFKPQTHSLDFIV